MDLKQALDRVGKFTSKRSADAAHQAVVVENGEITVTDGISGISIPFPGLKGLRFAVACAHFRAQVAALGSDPKIEVKGQRVSVKGKRGHFTIQQLDEARWPKRPKEPSDGWAEISAATVQALDLLAAYPDTEAQGSFQTQGVRLTKDWCAAGTSHAGAIVWVEGVITTDPVTVSPAVFMDLSGDVEIAVTKRHLWMITEDGETRWTTPFEGDWPDGFAHLVASNRPDEDGREEFGITPTILGEIAVIAAVESENDLASMRMTVDSTVFAITGGPQEATSDVATQAEIEGTPSKHVIGISPRHLQKVADTMSKLPGGGSICYVTVGAPIGPVIIRGDGSPVMEALVMPLRLLL